MFSLFVLITCYIFQSYAAFNHGILSVCFDIICIHSGMAYHELEIYYSMRLYNIPQNGSLPPFLLHLNQYLVIAICFHYSFWSVKNSREEFTSEVFNQSLQHYVDSGTAEVVRSAIWEIFKDDFASMSQVLSSDEGYNQVIDSLLQITLGNLMTHA
ncbi:hypothetical protein BD410DRAFT_382863 [Rickenella mellea]|uniref:Uncharacterized protein n=1 Tax=Rickenella mellea TaxID=50990 RepID=A0A4Y7PZ29_9AGAM|nr:hypothetical protein BD410DRAFT_382863 [Rickenella mellea]